jgi:hypothetical protein
MSEGSDETPTFTAANLMLALAEASGTSVADIAPDLDKISDVNLSPLESALGELRASPEYIFERDAERVIGFIDVIYEAENQHDIHSMPGILTDRPEDFQRLVKEFPVEVSPGFIQYMLDNPEDIIEREEAQNSHFAGQIIGIFFSVMLTKMPEAPEGEPPQKVELIIPSVLEGKMSAFGANFGGRRDLKIIGNPGAYAARNMSGGQFTIEAEGCVGAGAGMNGGELIIEGSAGNFTGQHMQGGELTVKGDAGKFTGNKMTGGILVVERNSGDKVGVLLDGGKIMVKGDAGADVGGKMISGALRVNGRVQSWGEPDENCTGTILQGQPGLEVIRMLNGEKRYK